MRHRNLLTLLLAALFLGGLPAAEAQPLALDGGLSATLDGGGEVLVTGFPGSSGVAGGTLQIYIPPIYFCDCFESPGRVWEYHPDTAALDALYTRPSGDLMAFVFAPGDPSRLYFTDSNRNEILAVSLASPNPTEEVVYTHTTYVRDVAFDGELRLYFSEASGAGADGKIYRLEADGTASLFFTVRLSEIDGYWGGEFGFAPDGALLLASGNTHSAGLFEADVATGTLTRLHQAPYLGGFTFDPGGALHVTYGGPRIDVLDVEAGTTRVAYDDPRHERICDVGFREVEPAGPSIPGLWVMPEMIGGVRLDRLKPTGLIDYTDRASRIKMENAPFGGTLGLVLSSAGAIPTDDVYYYRFRYRRQGAGAWTDFTAPVSVQYVRYRPGKPPIFPSLRLGPHNVNGMNLYRFRPHASELPQLVPPGPGTVEWRKVPIGPGYRGFLDTVPLVPGRYEIRLEVYNSRADVQPVPNSVFEMMVPAAAGAAKAPITDGGYQFAVHVDNRRAVAKIKPPTIGTSVADACGFLRYSPANPGTVRIGWQAWHPGKFAVYGLHVVRGQNPALPSISDEVGSPARVDPSVSDPGHFFTSSSAVGLLDGCKQAAFATTLHVYAKATTGNGYRITTYDASAVRAFALAPQ